MATDSMHNNRSDLNTRVNSLCQKTPMHSKLHGKYSLVWIFILGINKLENLYGSYKDSPAFYSYFYDNKILLLTVKRNLKEKSNWPNRVLLKENLSAMTNKDQEGTLAVLFPGVLECDFLGELLLSLLVISRNIDL